MSATLEFPPRVAAVAAAVAAFGVADPEAIERLSLQRRFDRKFILPAERAAAVVSSIERDYRVVLARDARLALYDTLYFDTPSLRSYHDHRRGRRPRFKVRIRNYVDRELSMLEFKEKTARGDTRKARWVRPSADASLSDADLGRLVDMSPRILDEGGLVPQARTVFHRLMLLSARSVERATLDFNLVLGLGDDSRALESLVVVEVKNAGRGVTSPLVAALHRHHARALSFSKYCVAMALLGRERSNAFRPALRALEGTP